MLLQALYLLVCAWSSEFQSWGLWASLCIGSASSLGGGKALSICGLQSDDQAERPLSNRHFCGCCVKRGPLQPPACKALSQLQGWTVIFIYSMGKQGSHWGGECQECWDVKGKSWLFFFFFLSITRSADKQQRTQQENETPLRDRGVSVNREERGQGS